MKPRHHRRCGLLTRRASAVIEFAICLPVIMVLLLGSIEMSRAVLVQHTLQEAAHGGARLYAAQDTTQQDVRDYIAVSMDGAGISDYRIAFVPADKAGIDEPMEPVRVTITVEHNDVAWVPGGFMSGRTIGSTCVMAAEVDSF